MKDYNNLYIENFFDLKESQFYMAQLTESVNWRIEKIKMWGKKIITKNKYINLPLENEAQFDFLNLQLRYNST